MPIRPTLSRAALAAPLFAFCVALPVNAAPLRTDTAKSSVSITFKQMGVPMTARFKRFSAQIDFDSAKPNLSKAIVDIDMTSFDLDDAAMNREAAKREWFDSAQFPKASFFSSALRGNGSKFDVTGKLNIKGRLALVSFPMTLKKDGGNLVFDGALPIKRLAFKIGEGQWRDTNAVADEVVIKFHVVTAQ